MSNAAVKVAGSVAAMVALVGCASGNPSVAAYVGADTISQAQVDGIAGVLAASTEDTTDTAASFGQTVTTLMVQSKLAAQVGSQLGIKVTDEQRKQVYDSNPLYAVLLANPATTGFMTDYANTVFIVTDEAGKAAFNDLVTKADVRLNPRLGVWDPAQGGVVEGSSGSISELAPATK